MTLPVTSSVIGVFVSILLFVASRDVVENAARLRFDRQTSDAKGVIEDRIHFYADILYGLKALFATQSSVTRLQFHDYVDALDLKNRYPGFDLVNYAVLVPANEKKRFEEIVRRDTSLDSRGYPQFTVRPAGQRSEYHVIVYVEPMSGFEFAFGLDLGANPAVAGADPKTLVNLQHAARDSGELTASGRPIRVKAGKEYVGLAMRLAVYQGGLPLTSVEARRAAYLGSVGAGFNVDNLMKGVLDEEMSRYMRFRLYDAGSSSELTPSKLPVESMLLFDSAGLSPARSAEPKDEVTDGSSFTRVLSMPVGGRIWEIHFSAPKEAVIDRLDTLFPSIVLVSGLLLSLLLSGVLYSLAFSRSRAVAIANDITKDLRESQTQLQALSRRLVEVQELERRRLSSELHDRVGQNLTALSINLDILKSHLPQGNGADVGSRLEDSTRLLESTADTIDNVMAELRPPMLDDYGLLAALNWHAKEFSRRTRIDVIVRGDEGGERPMPEIEITLFRIAQEALNNIAKHAQAHSAVIRLETGADECIMSVSDDGKGFAAAEPSAPRARLGLGMVTMRERSQAVGGRFEVRSIPGDGTQITIRIPR